MKEFMKRTILGVGWGVFIALALGVVVITVDGALKADAIEEARK